MTRFPGHGEEARIDGLGGDEKDQRIVELTRRVENLETILDVIEKSLKRAGFPWAAKIVRMAREKV